MLLIRQFLSELDDTSTQCSPVWYVYMILTDSRSGSYDVTDDVITYNNNNNNNNLIYIAPACRMTSEALADSSGRATECLKEK